VNLDFYIYCCLNWQRYPLQMCSHNSLAFSYALLGHPRNLAYRPWMRRSREGANRAHEGGSGTSRRGETRLQMPGP
jgi:hypothetical protein